MQHWPDDHHSILPIAYVNANYLDFHELKDQNSNSYLISMISGFVALIAGIFLLFNPLSGTLIITQIIGLIIVIYSAMDLIEKLRFKKGIKTKKPIEKVKIIDSK